MSADFTFVRYQDPGDRTRRIRSRRACNYCRHRKVSTTNLSPRCCSDEKIPQRRCNHERFSNGGNSSLAGSLVWKEPQTVSESHHALQAYTRPAGEQDESPRYRSTRSTRTEERQNQRQDDHQQDQSSLPKPGEEQSQPHLRADAHASPPTPRFVGDLNPEARLLDKNTTPENVQDMEPGEVGVWIQPRLCSKCGTSGTSGEGCSPSGPYISSRRDPEQSYPPVSEILPQKTVKTLSNVYFAKVHPIIPLLNEREYWESLSRSTIPPPLVHVVCLLAAKDSAAEKHLYLLRSRDNLVPVREFCTQLYDSISAELSRRSSLRKVTLMRILGLLSLHQEGPEGMEEASSCISQAIHHAQSLALHLPRPNDVDNELKRIFWCLWTLDRLNAVTNSRPCIMSDVDIAIEDLTPEESGSTAFDVCFRVAKMLNRIIALYRPKTKDPASGWDLDFPGFEEIMDEMHAWQLSQSTTATLHIFYLAAAILAHRLKTITSLPSLTPARLRQQLSSIQVVRYMQDPDRLNSLHPFPIVVYATSLALSVSYQQLRYSRLVSDQEDARQDFNTGCDILQVLRHKWGSADAMASLALRISTALNHVPNLDMLRVARPSRPEQDGNPTGQQTGGDMVEDISCQPSIQENPADRPTADPQETQSYLDAMDLFSGMDDVSWMYLDAENPINFDNFPLNSLDEPYLTGY